MEVVREIKIKEIRICYPMIRTKELGLDSKYNHLEYAFVALAVVAVVFVAAVVNDDDAKVAVVSIHSSCSRERLMHIFYYIFCDAYESIFCKGII